MQFMNETLTCLTCQQQQLIMIYPHIDIDSKSQLKQQILTNKLFQPNCDSCGAIFNLNYPCVYHDMEQKLLVYVAPYYQPGDEKTLKYDLFDEVEDSQGYHLRVVTNLTNLVESLQLFYHHLDDRVYQIAKELIGAQLQLQIAPRQLVSSIITTINNGELHFEFIDEQQQMYSFEINHEVVTLVEDIYQQYLQPSEDFELIDFVWARQMIEEFDI